MASYKGHLALACPLGAAYAAGAVLYYDCDWGVAGLGAGLTALGGLLPDLDSDSGVPVRELFSAAACIVPLLAHRRIDHLTHTHEQALVVMVGVYLFIRYVLGHIFKGWTSHRGMFHSLPAMCIAGLCVYLLDREASEWTRLFLAGGVMLGFLSHLVLDEIYAVDFSGARLKFNQFAGSAVKFRSKSWSATLFCYALLGGLGYLAWLDYTGQR
jgi:membrane-bound metal-dependent hydrolase YbcI (DUF457 family)